MNLKASSMSPPSQPWSWPWTSQSTNSCSDSEINFPVFSFTMPSVAATAENAQQQPRNNFVVIVLSNKILTHICRASQCFFTYHTGLDPWQEWRLPWPSSPSLLEGHPNSNSHTWIQKKELSWSLLWIPCLCWLSWTHHLWYQQIGWRQARTCDFGHWMFQWTRRCLWKPRTDVPSQWCPCTHGHTEPSSSHASPPSTSHHSAHELQWLYHRGRCNRGWQEAKPCGWPSSVRYRTAMTVLQRQRQPRMASVCTLVWFVGWHLVVYIVSSTY